jgi:hypothetical protein
MNPQEKISRLESMLERVRRNASAARVPSRIDGGAKVAAAVAPVEEPADLEIEELELGEDEFVDLTDAEVEEIPAEAAEIPMAAMKADESLDWEDVEEPPASSRRPIAAPSLDEALAQASAPVAMDEGREIPLKTPPPESGPQESMAPAFVTPALPGEVELPAPEGESLLELGEPPAAAVEFAEPERAPPVEAAPESGEISPHVVQRAALSQAAPSAYVAAVRSFRPSTFIELLDASLSLGE